MYHYSTSENIVYNCFDHIGYYALVHMYRLQAAVGLCVCIKNLVLESAVQT